MSPDTTMYTYGSPLFLMAGGFFSALLIVFIVGVANCARLYSAARRRELESSRRQGISAAALKKEPLPKDARVRLVETKLSDQPLADRTCAICLSEYELNDKLTLLPCKHHFHTACVDAWFDSNSSCPTCRHRLVQDDPEANIPAAGARPAETA